MDRCTENVIEFLLDGKKATVTFSQGRFKTRIRKLAAERAENQDGSMCAHIPVSWIKIFPVRETSEKSRQLSRERMIAYNSKSTSTVHEKG